MKLLKFRTLNEYNYHQICDIIETGKFWMSSLWNLNDVEEGTYLSKLDEKSTNRIFSNKNKYKICSFSHEDEINNSLLWGYYANGYRGIAIKVKIDDESKLKKVNYRDDNKIFENIGAVKIMELITKKSSKWAHENEYRYLLEESEEGCYEIDEIVKIYFGNPYANVRNRKEIEENSLEYKKYLELSKRLQKFCKDKGINWELLSPDFSSRQDSQKNVKPPIPNLQNSSKSFIPTNSSSSWNLFMLKKCI